MFDIAGFPVRPTFTIPGRDLVAVDVSYPTDSGLINEVIACSVVRVVAPGLAALPDAAQRLAETLQRIRRRQAPLHDAARLRTFCRRGVTAPRRELATAGRSLSSGYAEWSGHMADPLVLVVALLPLTCLSATIRLPLGRDLRSIRGKSS